MYDLIVFLPLLGFLIAGIFGRWIGARGAEYVTTSLLGVSFVLSWIAFFRSRAARTLMFRSATGSPPASSSSPGRLRIDTLTAVMLVVVTTVSFLVHVYSIGYMSDDPSRPRFFAYLSLFTFAMLMLVTADNLVQLFFGWEGVGLMSYLLIGFWYERPSANAAAIKAFVVNRVGDFGFALGIFLTFSLTGSIAFDQVFAAAPGSCRQDGAFHRLRLGRGDARLPAPVHGRDGQVGAVPASHLASRRDGGPDPGLGPHSCGDHGDRRRVHGGAAVAAVRAVARPRSASCTIVGATTAFFAATVGLVQNDIKKVIAYSTCSQLGYMFVGLGVGGYSLGIFHLFTHAFFKALLFLGAGSVITAMHHEQDMRRDGRAAQGDPVHLLDDDDRHAGADRRRHSVHVDRLRRLRLEGRDHRGCLRLAPLRRGLCASCASTSPPA